VTLYAHRLGVLVILTLYYKRYIFTELVTGENVREKVRCSGRINNRTHLTGNYA